MKKKNRVIVRLNGGLGNQMFQYAAGLSLSLKLKGTLLLDTSLILDDKLREFCLDDFNINAEIISKEEFKSEFFLPIKVIRKLSYLNNLIFNKKFYREKSFNYDKNFLNLKGNICIDGFWQSEKYFKNISDILKRQFSLNKKISKNSENILKKIKACNSISCHIRRADYVTNPETNSYHGTCSIEWYMKSIKYIHKKVKDPKFFIFSDDIKWVEKNFPKDSNFKFVPNTKYKRDVEDLYLMSNCKHNIIANSSFSWWSAWLNNNKNKIIIAPKNWFKVKIDTTDLIPANWIRH